jgi:hypothetical protein
MSIYPKFIENQNDEPTGRVQVELDSSAPLEPKVKVRQQTWSEDLGWLTQKTLTLELEQAQDLMRELNQAINWGKAKRSQAYRQPDLPPENQPEPENKIIAFPVKIA